jgi:predicted permease
MSNELGLDLRHTLRVLARSPGFTVVAVLSLALGIGANTAMFGVVSTLLLTPLPVDAPEELMLVTWAHDGDVRISNYGSTDYEDPESGERYRSNFTYPTFTALRDGAPPGVDLFAFAFIRGASVALGDQPAFLAGGALADGRYFRVLRPPMALGRPLTEEDDAPGAPIVAVLSHSFWMRGFGGDPEVLGRTIRVNGVPAEVVGVTGEAFKGLSMGGFFPQTEITVPLASQPRIYPALGPGGTFFTADDLFWLRVMARVSSGTDDRVAQDALEATFRAQPSPITRTEEPPRLRLLPGSQGAQPVSSERARLLYFLLGVVGIVLLIACVNLASLMLARGVARQREVAVRRALGAGRARLVRGVLMESLVLSALGTAIGLGLVVALGDLLGALLTGSVGAGGFGSLDIRVEIEPGLLALTAVAGVAATLFFGLLPALRLSGVDPATWLKGRTASSASPRLTVGRLLVGVQVGFSLPLVVGAALFLRTVANLGAVELGFDPTGVATFPLDPRYAGEPPEGNARLYQEVLASLQEIPGVRSVTLMENVLMSGVVSNGTVTVDDRSVILYRNAVGPALIETLGMRLLAGRMPGLQDGPDAPRIGVVNETAVGELFGGASPVGRVLDAGGGRQVTIVGVVNDTPYRSRRAAVPATLYESALQRDGYGGHNVVLRTDVPVAQLEAPIREAVYRIDPDLPVPRIRSQTEIMAQSTARERVFTQLLTLFGAFALFLAAIGLHGVTSYSVTRRTSEIGVRLAVGARPGQILWMVLRQVVMLAGAGLVVGVPLSLWAAPVAGTLLYGVEPTDWATIVAGAVVMVLVAAGAGLLPAARAARLDAAVALSTE